MPGGDGTGPNGMGSMTGRRMGFCAGFNTPGYANRPRFGYGRGFGGGGVNRPRLGMAWRRGRGGGGGYGWNWQSPFVVNPVIASSVVRNPMAPTNQVEMLKQEKEYLKSELTEIQKAIEDISKSIENMEKEE